MMELAPLHGDTIPRLELTSALVLARLIASILEAFKKTLEISSVVYWLDSQISLNGSLNSSCKTELSKSVD